MANGPPGAADHAPSSGGGAPSSSSTVALLAPRATAVVTLILVLVWVHKLGGAAWVVDHAADGSVSTDRLFNLHPVLMTLAFGLFMTEAVLAYKAPWSQGFSRPQRKRVHYGMHSAAVLCAVLGFLAAWKSHTLKDPPVPNLYSPHSYMGMAALVLMGAQFAAGFAAYLWPTISLEQRQALGPYHRFLGLSTWATGMAAAAIGLQEKATFLQVFGKKDVYSPFIRLPAVAELLLLAMVLLVAFQYALASPPPGRRAAVHYSPVTGEEMTV